VAGGIYISYRRDDSPGYARLIYNRLSDELGRDKVFFDAVRLQPGADWAKILSERVLAGCEALVAVIGRKWLRRLDSPQDFVRFEIGEALKGKIRVFPVLVDGAEMPREMDLPLDIRGLARRQGIRISPITLLRTSASSRERLSDWEFDVSDGLYISFRRENASATAWRICDRLISHLVSVLVDGAPLPSQGICPTVLGRCCSPSMAARI
jgi:hypothetical protein